MRLAKLDCAWMQFSGILSVLPRNHFGKMNPLFRSEGAGLYCNFCVHIAYRLHSQIDKNYFKKRYICGLCL